MEASGNQSDQLPMVSQVLCAPNGLSLVSEKILDLRPIPETAHLLTPISASCQAGPWRGREEESTVTSQERGVALAQATPSSSLTSCPA